MSETQSVCKHCGAEIIKIVLGWIAAKSRDILCFTEMSVNPRQGGHEPVAEPASTGEPPLDLAHEYCDNISSPEELWANHGQAIGEFIEWLNEYFVVTARPSGPLTYPRQCERCKGILEHDLDEVCHGDGFCMISPSGPSAPQTSAEPSATPRFGNECQEHWPENNPDCEKCRKFWAPAPQPVSGEDEAFWKFMDDNAEIVKRWPGWKRVAAGLPEVPVSGDAPKVEAIMLFDEFCRRFTQFSNYIPAEDRNTYLIPLLEKLRCYFPPASQTPRNLYQLFKHKEGCTWLDPLPTGVGTWGCSCGLDNRLLDMEDYELAANPASTARTDEPTKPLCTRCNEVFGSLRHDRMWPAWDHDYEFAAPGSVPQDEPHHCATFPDYKPCPKCASQAEPPKEGE